jgi:ATP-dependent exoDNAse (exonuclease V) alpha subunit
MALDTLSTDLHAHISGYLDHYSHIQLVHTCHRLNHLRTYPHLRNNAAFAMCDLFHQLFDRRRNVFLTGAGGTGKTEAMRRVYEMATKLEWDICMTATTGIASTYLPEGTTLHSFIGSREWNMDQVRLEAYLAKYENRPSSKKRLQKTKLLVVDEVSMLGQRMLERCDFLTRYCRSSASHVPFGGIQVLFVGDFYQLSPVGDRYCFHSPVWNQLQLHLVEFIHSFRHDTNEQYSRLLKRVRHGECLSQDLALLQSRIIDETLQHQVSLKEIAPVELYSRHKDADLVNQAKFSALRSPYQSVYFMAQDQLLVAVPTYVNGVRQISMFNYNGPLTMQDIEKDIQDLNRKAPRVVEIKHGAQYLLTCNFHVRSGWVNGQRIRAERNEQKQYYEAVLENGDRMDVSALRKVFTHRVGNVQDAHGNQLFLKRYQVAMKLGYALTIHSSQGTTLNEAIIDIGSSVFASQQPYVALSRVSDLQGLYLRAFDPKRIRINKEVDDFYASQRRGEPYVSCKPPSRKRKREEQEEKTDEKRFF